jgi:type II secretory pathway pseudopilin PulG
MTDHGRECPGTAEGSLILSTRRAPAGFTIPELCITLLAIGLLAMVAVARLRDMRQTNSRNPLQCQENLRFIAIALQDFATDHEDRFPWEVPHAQGGSEEAIPSGQASPHFRSLTNTIRNTRTLLCPMDPMRYRGATLTSLDDSAISYFLNISARRGSKNAILAGDRTISTTPDNTTGGLDITSKSVLQWTLPAPDEPGHQEIRTHETTGNLVLNNGSLMETTSFQLQRVIRALGTNTHRFILP